MTARRLLKHGLGIPALLTALWNIVWQIAPEMFVALGLTQSILTPHIPGLDASDLTALVVFFGVIYLISILDRAWEDVTS